MNTPREIKHWADLIDEQSNHAPTPSQVVELLNDYAELLEDMQTLTRILNKWSP